MCNEREESLGHWISPIAECLGLPKTSTPGEVLEEAASVRYAAHMPDDYQYGLPSWINQWLYLAYLKLRTTRRIVEEHEGHPLIHVGAVRYIKTSAGWYREVRSGDSWVYAGIPTMTERSFLELILAHDQVGQECDLSRLGANDVRSAD